jgi:alcohol dehydrogenase (NADP+)
MEIMYSGICHSDVHVGQNDFGITSYPCVPGHEILGKVKEIGDKVTKFKVGDLVGVGCFVDSCRDCS